MDENTDELAREYASSNEAELLDLARAYDSLTDSAQGCLRSEFARRKLEPPLIDNTGEDLLVSRNLVTVRRYRDLSEAIVARSLLESSGIHVYLCDENLLRLDWQLSNFIGGLRLQVEREDEQAATELLAQPAPDAISYGGDTPFTQAHCPHCHSTNLTFEGSSRKAALTSLYLLSVPIPLGPETWTCDDCGSRWEDTEPE